MNIQTVPESKEIEAVLGLDGKSRARRWLSRLLWLALLAAAIAAIGWWYWERSSQAALLSYETLPATRGNLTITVTATGKIQPTTQVDVSSEMSGIVRRVLVDNNSLVKKDDVLAELDTVRLIAQRNRAQATLAAAEARIADAKATLAERKLALARAETLRSKGISAVQELDAARAAFDRAEAGLSAALADADVARADLALKETDIASARIVSPVDGIVLKRSVEPGQTVASSLQAPVLFTIAEDLTRMQVEADIDEADIGAVATGQKASFTVDAYPGRKFTAETGMIEFSPQTTEGVVTYKAVLIVDNRDLLLRPGMTATAEIVVREIPEALTVPNAALRYSPPEVKKPESFSFTRLFMPRMPRFERATNNDTRESERSLWVLEGGIARQIKVTVGASNGERTEILDGVLAEGTDVVISARQAAR
jgi:HlyD family secretion protein